MADPDVDLLAFSNIKDEVDRIFRAYLDTQLLEFANTYEEPSDYWHHVLTFRNDTLKSKPFLKGKEPEEPQDPLEAAKAIPRRSKSGDEPGDFSSFYYWFDVRAQHWASRPRDEIENLIKELVPAKKLKWLATQARDLEQRIKPPSSTGLKNILSGVKAPPEAAGAEAKGKTSEPKDG